jgi:putative ABC transport system ATP-binding protein
MISLRHLRKTYRSGAESVAVLKGISLEIEAGEFVAIMGSSGSGKSTLLNVIGCIDTVESGSYHLDGVDVSKMPDHELTTVRGRKIGFVFQQFNLIPRIDALRNVELPLVYAGVAQPERHERAWWALCRVGLQARATHSPAQLSGGQQQRIALARALVNDPALLIADEPTGSLDSATSHDIMQLFCEFRREGKTIVMVTHEADIAAYADRTVRLRDGIMVEETSGAPDLR